MMKLDIPSNRDDPITVHYNDYSDGGKVGVPKTIEVDLVIGADGANSRVAKDIDAGECDFAIAFQVRWIALIRGVTKYFLGCFLIRSCYNAVS